jgi:hypothetical protein
VTEFKYLVASITNQNCIHKEIIKSRLNSGNVFYHAVQGLLSYCVCSKNLKIEIYKTIILPVFMGVKFGLWN